MADNLAKRKHAPNPRWRPPRHARLFGLALATVLVGGLAEATTPKTPTATADPPAKTSSAPARQPMAPRYAIADTARDPFFPPKKPTAPVAVVVAEPTAAFLASLIKVHGLATMPDRPEVVRVLTSQGLLNIGDIIQVTHRGIVYELILAGAEAPASVRLKYKDETVELTVALNPKTGDKP